MAATRLIVVGTGGMAGTWWDRTLAGRADVKVVATVDPRLEAAVSYAARAGLSAEQAFISLAAAVDAVDADAVLICSPPAFHAADAVLAASRGLHVLTEKPIATSLAEAREMVHAADRARTQLVVGQNRRYEAWTSTVRDLIRSGTIGRLGGVHAEHFIGTMGVKGYRAALPHILLEDMAVHHLDLVRHLTGQNVVRVSARLHNPPFSPNAGTMAAYLLMDLADGTPFTYAGSWVAAGRTTSWGADWRIQGETGAVHVVLDKVVISRGKGRDPRQETGVEFPPVTDRGLGSLLAGFLEAIRTGEPAETSGRDNLWTLGIIEAAVLSDQTGRAVEVEPLVRAAD